MFLSSKAALGRNPLLDRVGQKLLQKFGGAAAAYSLRALNGNSDNVVRVRRDSDNDEKDFTASDVSSGALTNWVNTQIVPPLDIGVETDDGRVPVSEGGTSIGEPSAAYSLRNLKPSYTGDVVDVRRSSDNATESFNATEVADGTLENWVGSGNDGFVSIWYDQSTAENDAEQNDPTKQPKIVDSGSLVSGGLDFDGVDDFLATTQGYIVELSQNPASVFCVATPDNTGEGYLLVEGDSLATYSSQFTLNGVDGTTTAWVNTTEFGSGFPASKALGGFIYNGIEFQAYLNGSTDGASATAVINSETSVQSYIGARADGTTDFFAGKVSEIITYKSDQSDNRTAIEANIGETYGITGIPAYDNTVNGFVETWYDQSGNGNNATQLTAGNQPKIVDGGSLVTGGLTFDGVNDYFTCPSLYSANLSVFSKLNTDSTNSSNYMRILHICDGSDSFQITRGGNTDVGTFMSKNTSFQASAVGFNHGSISGNSLLTSITSGSATESYANGSLRSNGSATIGDGGNTTTTIGARCDLLSSTFFNNAIAEIIIYNIDQSDNRTGIEDNINNYYNIY